MQHDLVCRGRIHAAVDTLMQSWDSAAIIPCIEEAGAIATTLSGQREGIVFGGDLLTSSDASLHHEIFELLQSTRELPALLLPAPHSIMLHVCNQHPD